MKKIVIPLFLGLLMLTGCHKKQKEELMSEGLDTPVEIIAYHTYEDSDYFLSAGDKIAVISPSSYPDEKKKDAVISGLKDWGYVPVEGRYAVGRCRTIENVIEDLTWALKDPGIKAIFCIRGGSASSEVLDDLDPELIGRYRKPIIGFSDITTFLSAWTRKGLPSVHATMSAAFDDLEEGCAKAQRHLMEGEIPTYRCKGNSHDKKGTAEGILIGGNLSVLLSTLSTDYDPTLIDEPYILFLEYFAENMEHVHRYLTVLKHEGILDKAAGLIFGEWIEYPEDAEAYDGSSRGGRFTSMADMIDRQFLKDLVIPVAFSFPAGHSNINYPLLMGSRIKLTVEEDSYTIEWK